jgi:hypothetical protein
MSSFPSPQGIADQREHPASVLPAFSCLKEFALDAGRISRPKAIYSDYPFPISTERLIEE